MAILCVCVFVCVCVCVCVPVCGKYTINTKLKTHVYRFYLHIFIYKEVLMPEVDYVVFVK